MGQRHKFVDLASMHHLMDGLSFKVSRCADVLDDALAGFNDQTRVPERIIAWRQRGEDPSRFPTIPVKGRLIAEINQSFEPSTGQTFCACTVRGEEKDPQVAPVVFFNMQSPTLDIPMRVEVPLRALLKGGRKLQGTYSVYLHALLTDVGEEFVYYGITKRGWNTRFSEHVNSSIRNGSQRLFPRKLEELIDARAAEVSGVPDGRPKLAGIITAICAAGLMEAQAMNVEEYLVDKYSLSSKHKNGLNMIPGGYEGIRSLHRLSIIQKPAVLDTEAREHLLDGHLRRHPRLGASNPGVAAKWDDPAYAEAVICGRENRLNADQVREIRHLAALGHPVDDIQERVGALDHDQVARVLARRTYVRVH